MSMQQILLDALPLGIVLMQRDGSPKLWNRNTTAEQRVIATTLVKYKESSFETSDGERFLRYSVTTLEKGLGPIKVVIGHLVTIQDITRERLLERDALIDPLTSLGNRREYERRLKQEQDRLCRLQISSLGIIEIDVDKFKHINDRYGHPVGDRVLKAIARVIAENVRATDIPCRTGGDEYMVLMPNVSGDLHASVDTKLAVERIAKRICAEVKKIRFSEPGLEDLRVSVTIGGADQKSGPEAPAFDLIGAVDAALYEAKELRGRVVMR